ncbi:alpha-ketoglutarate-dependent dioxygenase AlkB [Microcoleus sp. FACHB-SPT15]|uniref:alpha-ketoglutarate-dependent dioxygenase AlkB n=1 Tax=Microcoleus sp. FACHB-SPT15 TaxID=2692830 RepID=UPI001780E1B8|nr:alpha-ketoglutarate-dependent dioxygenase AlkB [Microcoleus sp. FACHB-SPT15]MBD1807584.1 alpha-ketoglutarate-dependent dioxygenase AlkB [Microcoleus sp. FACHB-SPT15]
MLSPNKSKLDLTTTLEADSIEISGLTYVPEYITFEEQNQLIHAIDQQEWSMKLKRRVQHYGYRYDYKNGSLASANYLGALPDWAEHIANRLFNDKLTEKAFDQLIVNEYQPGQGIISHVDCVPCFGNTIISLSLGSPCLMDFTHSQTHQKVSLLLSAGSLVVMHREARYLWQHGIAPRKKDNYKGTEITRTRRISMTFREVLFPYK